MSPTPTLLIVAYSRTGAAVAALQRPRNPSLLPACSAGREAALHRGRTLRSLTLSTASSTLPLRTTGSRLYQFW